MSKKRIYILLIIAAGLFAYWAVSYFDNPTNAEIWQYNFPSEHIDTPYFTMDKLAGWIGGFREQYDEDTKPMLVSLSTYMDLSCNDVENFNVDNFQESANFIILRSRSKNADDWLSMRSSRIISDIRAQKLTDERFAEFYKYEGPLRIILSKEGDIKYEKSKETNVYIALYYPPDLWIVYRGFKKYESDFWNMIESIQLKEHQDN